MINYYQCSFLSLFTFDCCPAMLGIAFMLINVRVGLGSALTPEATTTGIKAQVDNLPLKFVVNISTETDRDSDLDVGKEGV